MDLLLLAQMALNSRPSSAIGGMSPFFLRNGYNVEPLMEPTPAEGPASRHPGSIDAQKYIQRLKDAQEFAQAAMASAWTVTFNVDSPSNIESGVKSG